MTARQRERLDPPADLDHDDHLVLTKPLRIAYELGVDVQALCGVWVKPWKLEETGIIKSVGGLIPLTVSDDCPDCAAELARRFEHNARLDSAR